MKLVCCHLRIIRFFLSLISVCCKVTKTIHQNIDGREGVMCL